VSTTEQPLFSGLKYHGTAKRFAKQARSAQASARPFAIALALVGAIVVVSMIAYWRRPEGYDICH